MKLVGDTLRILCGSIANLAGIPDFNSRELEAAVQAPGMTIAKAMDSEVSYIEVQCMKITLLTLVYQVII